MARRRKTTQAIAGFEFFEALRQFYEDNRGRIRSHYRDLTKRFLDYNDPTNAHAFLRRPQFEALEMYVFLKEYLDNAPVHAIFDDWRTKQGRFAARTSFARSGQLAIEGMITGDQYKQVFERMRAGGRSYANYIFALTMGTGKTILMATCIFYEFILANKFPKDAKYCHNAVVFAPDTTVLEALREMQTFDMGKVVPPEYVNFLTANIQYHFLDEAGKTLDTMDRSMFNIIISNTQKIILKRQHGQKSAASKLFQDGKPTYQAATVYDEYADLYALEPQDADDLATNQRFEKLRRLGQLGIYVDEAHHAFGTSLAQDVGAMADKRKTSLRLTIDELASSLERTGTHVVACYNYTGTPYAKNELLPEVVYAFGLQTAINEGYLKRVEIKKYRHVHDGEFVSDVVGDFIKNVGDQRFEGMLPKLAFFAPTIDELETELRPAVERALAKHGIGTDRILVNVGDAKLTTNDDLREFRRLDTPQSEKQYILLVNKGREGWNCRSLFGVGLSREPKSKIFVLQATMRCLRAIGEGQPTGHVYLSEANEAILQEELKQNFRLTVDELVTAGSARQNFDVRVTEPPVTIKLTRVKRLFRATEKEMKPGAALELGSILWDNYTMTRVTYDGLPTDSRTRSVTEDISAQREQRRYSRLTLVAEVARYLNKPCLEVEQVLDQTAEGTDTILAAVNRANEVLYDWVIPRLFKHLYEIREYEDKEEHEIELVKRPDRGYYTLSAEPDKVVSQDRVGQPKAAKSFHLDTYCFDSNPERDLFWRLLGDERVQKVYFTGMLTHGQSEFFIQYIDPESNTLRSYYPDFLVQKTDGSWVIIEVKGDNKIEDSVVKAKARFAEQIAAASGMKYKVILGSGAKSGNYDNFFNGQSFAEQAQIEGMM